MNKIRLGFIFLLFLAVSSTSYGNNKSQQTISSLSLKKAVNPAELVIEEISIDTSVSLQPAQSTSSFSPLETGVSSTSQTLPDEIGGYACNVSHTPNDEQKWSINLHNLNKGLYSSKVIFSITQNRKIQSVSCTPNGRYILFSMKETQRGDYEIYSMDLTTSDVLQLTDNDTDDVDVTMSEDGSTKAWQHRLPDNRQAITLRTYSSSSEYSDRTLASASPFVQPSLSANGEWLVLVQLKNNFILTRYDIQNNQWKSVKSVPRRIKIYHPSISNDGNKVGWLERKNQKRFYLKNIENNTTQLILNIPTGISHPRLTYDGKWLAYSINDDLGGKVFITHLGSGETIQLGDSLAVGNRFLAVNWMGRFVNDSGSSDNYGGCVTIGKPVPGLKINYTHGATTFLHLDDSVERFIFESASGSQKYLIETEHSIKGNYRYITKSRWQSLTNNQWHEYTYSPFLREPINFVCVGQTIHYDGAFTFTDSYGSSFQQAYDYTETVTSINSNYRGKVAVQVSSGSSSQYEDDDVYYDIDTGVTLNGFTSIKQVDISQYQ